MPWPEDRKNLPLMMASLVVGAAIGYLICFWVHKPTEEVRKAPNPPTTSESYSSQTVTAIDLFGSCDSQSVHSLYTA
jgi:hypothetical protein